MSISHKKKTKPEPEPDTDTAIATQKGFGASIAATLISAVLSSLCCLAPLLYLVFGVSVAGLTWLQHFSWLQWPMMGVSLLLLGFGFWRLYFSSKLYCSTRFSLKTMRILYWIAVPVVLIVLFYPFFLPWVLELLV